MAGAETRKRGELTGMRVSKHAANVLESLVALTKLLGDQSPCIDDRLD